MNKQELVSKITMKTGQSKAETERTVSAMIEVIEEALKTGSKIALVGFGTFEVTERAARSGRNPQTGDEIQIAACKSPRFKPGKTLKAAVNC